MSLVVAHDAIVQRFVRQSVYLITLTAQNRSMKRKGKCPKERWAFYSTTHYGYVSISSTELPGLVVVPLQDHGLDVIT